MCTLCMSNCYLCDFFIEIIDNVKKLEEGDGVGGDVYILHVKRYAIRTCSGFER
jgi:hypothetical protein